jgi:hypothetical protein
MSFSTCGVFGAYLGTPKHSTGALAIVNELRRPLMSKFVAGAEIVAGVCGEDDITSANLEQMAATLETRPPTDDDRRELVEILRWLAKLVRELEAPSSK